MRNMSENMGNFTPDETQELVGPALMGRIGRRLRATVPGVVLWAAASGALGASLLHNAEEKTNVVSYDAELSPTADGYATFDGGIPGKARIPESAPLGIGANIRLG